MFVQISHYRVAQTAQASILSVAKPVPLRKSRETATCNKLLLELVRIPGICKQQLLTESQLQT